MTEPRYELYDQKNLTIEQLREGYRIFTGLNNDSEFTDQEIYKYMLEVLYCDSVSNDNYENEEN